MGVPFTVVAPVVITDANFVSSTIDENDHLEYDEEETCAIGNRRIVSSGGIHKVYESLAAGNLGQYPPDSPMSWVEVGPTNRWAAFDESGGTVSSGASPLEFVVSGDLINSICLLEMSAASVRIQASSPGTGTYYDKTFTLADMAIIDDWFEWFNAEFRRSRDVIVTDIPAVANSEYTITLTSDDAVSLGTFVMGKKSEFGFTQYKPKASIIDYSRKEVDQFGKINMVRRGYSKRMDVNIELASHAVDSVARNLTDLRATPAVWIGAKDQYELLTIYGYYRDWSIDIAYPTKSYATLQIEGLS